MGGAKRLAAEHVFVVVNPRAGRGRAARAWPGIDRYLRQSFGTFDVGRTQARGDATAMVREAVARGAELIVAVGGDGTINEAVNGLVGDDGTIARHVRFGTIAEGTGSDFARTLTPGRSLAAAVDALREAPTRFIDVGRARFRDPPGGLRTRLFVNVASFGLSGEIDRIVEERREGLLPGKAVFFLAALQAITRHRFHRVRLVFDDAETLETDVALIAAANGRYFGGGMQIAPDAEIDDGLLDIVVLERTSKARLVKDLPLVYRGAHRTHPAITIRRARTLSAEILDAAQAPVLLDIDGETPGHLPVTFDLLPKALGYVG